LASSANTSSDEATSVMESPEEDSRVAVGTFTGLGVGLLGQIGGVCCCSKNKCCMSLSVLPPASAQWTKILLSFYTDNYGCTYLRVYRRLLLRLWRLSQALNPCGWMWRS